MNHPEAVRGEGSGPAVDADPSAQARPLRRDAQRNRRLILDAAAALFAERGLEAGFDEIARRAGVGVGTVYRRFPDREDLIDALFVEQVDSMVGLAEECAAVADPWTALVSFIERLVGAATVNRGLREVLGAGARGRERLASTRERLDPAMLVLVDRAQQAGVLRPDVQVADIAVLGMLASTVSTTKSPDLWRRYLAIFLDGLRASPDDPSRSLPLRPPDPTEIPQFMRPDDASHHPAD